MSATAQRPRERDDVGERRAGGKAGSARSISKMLGKGWLVALAVAIVVVLMLGIRSSGLFESGREPEAVGLSQVMEYVEAGEVVEASIDEEGRSVTVVLHDSRKLRSAYVGDYAGTFTDELLAAGIETGVEVSRVTVDTNALFNFITALASAGAVVAAGVSIRKATRQYQESRDVERRYNTLGRYDNFYERVLQMLDLVGEASAALHPFWKVKPSLEELESQPALQSRWDDLETAVHEVVEKINTRSTEIALSAGRLAHLRLRSEANQARKGARETVDYSKVIGTAFDLAMHARMLYAAIMVEYLVVVGDAERDTYDGVREMFRSEMERWVTAEEWQGVFRGPEGHARDHVVEAGRNREPVDPSVEGLPLDEMRERLKKRIEEEVVRAVNAVDDGRMTQKADASVPSDLMFQSIRMRFILALSEFSDSFDKLAQGSVDQLAQETRGQ